MDGVYYALSKYCTAEEFVSGLQTISEDISVVNLPPIPMYDAGDPGLTLAALINTIWTLLQHRQKLVENQQNLEQKVHSLTQDLSFCKEKQKKLEKSLLDSQDDLIREKKKAVLLESDNSGVVQSVKFLKQEIQELKHQLKGRAVQFKHDLQRQNNEISELQSKLRKLLSKEGGEKWRGPVENSSKLKMSDEEKTYCMELVYKKSIHRLENNVHTLVKENLELRKLLDNVSDDLAQLMSQTRMSDCTKPEEGLT